MCLCTVTGHNLAPNNLLEVEIFHLLGYRLPVDSCSGWSTVKCCSNIQYCIMKIVISENVFKSVPGKLVKEKGQNLKSFLKSFQSSTVQKLPRPDFSKVAELAAAKEDRLSPLILRHVSISS